MLFLSLCWRVFTGRTNHRGKSFERMTRLHECDHHFDGFRTQPGQHKSSQHLSQIQGHRTALTSSRHLSMQLVGIWSLMFLHLISGQLTLSEEDRVKWPEGVIHSRGWSAYPPFGCNSSTSNLHRIVKSEPCHSVLMQLSLTRTYVVRRMLVRCKFMTYPSCVGEGNQKLGSLDLWPVFRH